METILYQLESETIELYYGCEIQQQKSSKKFAGYWFYFIRWVNQIHDGRKQPMSKVYLLDQRDNVQEIEQEVSDAARKMLMDYINPKTDIFHKDIIPINEFNPNMHWREKYDDVIRIIQSQELIDKLKELRDDSPDDEPQAKLSI